MVKEKAQLSFGNTALPASAAACLHLNHFRVSSRRKSLISALYDRINSEKKFKVL